MEGMRAAHVLAVVLLVLLLGSMALADSSVQLEQAKSMSDWQIQYEGSNPVFIWSPDCWTNCTLTLDVDFSAAPGGSSYFKLYGEKDSDPLVTQTVLNGSGTNWLDWHVDILNGTIDRNDAPVVHKTEANSSNWQIQYLHNVGYTDGFGASWIGGSSSVGTGQHLSVRFRWTPNGQGPVTIRQYPTDTGSFIPEPSSVLALASGLASMGIAFIRRRSC